ncbi:MAG: hypothetical protein U1F98_17955 [Verrucomicrobiota bacterium]
MNFPRAILHDPMPPAGGVPAVSWRGSRRGTGTVFRPKITPARASKKQPLFTPCTPGDSLLEAVIEATKGATTGSVICLHPLVRALIRFKKAEQIGERLCRWVESISRGGH